jgi:hypothetical protein
LAEKGGADRAGGETDDHGQRKDQAG